MPLRVVLDTNILLRGLLNMRSACGGVVDLCDRRAVILLVSKPVISEYREVLTDATIIERYPIFTREMAEVAIRRLRYVGNVVRRLQPHFDYPRDPRDAKFIDLAIAGGATHVVTGDNDLLALVTGHGDAAKRFRHRAPRARVLDAAAFLNEIERAIG